MSQSYELHIYRTHTDTMLALCLCASYVANSSDSSTALCISTTQLDLVSA